MTQSEITQAAAEYIVRVISKEMGYNLLADRISRIAAEAIKIQKEFDNGRASWLSLLVAFDLDILLYGDPKAPIMNLKGFHNVLEGDLQ